MKILIIEDELHLVESIKNLLESDLHICETASDFFTASEKIWDYDYDLLVLDLMLPGGNGLDLLAEAKKKNPKVGVIIISAKDSLDDKLKGLDEGADDYLAKPFHLAELSSRVKAIDRRLNFEGTESIVFNEINVAPEERKVMVNGTVLNLTKKEYQLLLFFISSRGRVLSREAITEHLWGDDSDTFDNLDFIYTHIRNLRKKISQAGGTDYIKSVHGFGYKFTDK
jgi:DNA-binding response OmpR family regulator